MDVSWANADQSYTLWFPTVDAAKAALAALAREHSRDVHDNGFRADLTAPGCNESSAWVTRLGAGN